MSIRVWLEDGTLNTAAAHCTSTIAAARRAAGVNPLFLGSGEYTVGTLPEVVVRPRVSISLHSAVATGVQKCVSPGRFLRAVPEVRNGVRAGRTWSTSLARHRIP